jgi:multidrug efflux pump subunit AcrA (membrane-fusion protein)
MKYSYSLFILLSLFLLQSACSDKQEHSPESLGSLEPISVSAIDVASERVSAVVEAPGTVQPRNRIAISAQINGFVREIKVRVGDRVRRDQVLMTLDARDAESQQAAAQAAIEEAEAALTEAEKAYQAAVEMRSAAEASAELADQTYARYQKLFESRSVSPQEMDEIRMRQSASAAELASREAMVAAAESRIKQVKARISQARAQASRADVMVSWTQVKAPASGRIVERTVDAGTAIFPGSPLVVIDSTANPQVLASLPTEHLGSLGVGSTVRVLGAAPALVYEGRVAEIVPQSNPATHSVEFKVNLPSDFALPNGQFVRVEVPVGTRDAILVPGHAVRLTGQLTGLFVVDGDSKARFRLAKVTQFDADRYEVLSGLEPGETVITQLNHTIVEGIPVETK